VKPRYLLLIAGQDRIRNSVACSLNVLPAPSKRSLFGADLSLHVICPFNLLHRVK